eukprot:s5506_g2.t1
MRPKPLGPLTLNEAVETWVLMLGLAGADDVGGRPGLVLPSYTVNSITETLWSYDARDRLTLVLAFNQLVQRLMVAVGRTIESAIETEAHSKNGMVEVEVEEAAMIQVFVGDTNEDFDSMTLMMKGLNYQANKYTDEEWTGSCGKLALITVVLEESQGPGLLATAPRKSEPAGFFLRPKGGKPEADPDEAGIRDLYGPL